MHSWSKLFKLQCAPSELLGDLTKSGLFAKIMKGRLNVALAL